METGVRVSRHHHIIKDTYGLCLRAFLFLGVIVWSAGCSSVRPSALARIEESKKLPKNIHILDFDYRGRLVNPAEVSRAQDEIRKKSKAAGRPQKLLILSLGWNYDRDGVLDEYTSLITNYLNYVSSEKGVIPAFFTNNWDVFIVSWDSSQRGVRRFMNDLIPSRAMNEYVSWVPDKILFPFSFWSKAALADKIGYGDLRSAMENTLSNLSDDQASPCVSNVYLVGHSLGCRILSGMVKQHLGAVPVACQFKHEKLIKGALFIEPAAVELNLAESTYYFPTIVTQTRHDHANGFLYTVANLPLNAFTFSGIEVLKMRYNATILNSASNAVDSTFVEDLFGLPFSVVWTLGATPLNYFYNQAYQLWHRNLNYPLDTLAQVPVIKIPVGLLDDTFGHGETNEVERWGSTHRGLFGLGAIDDAASSAVSPILGTWSTPDVAYLGSVTNDSYKLPNTGLHYVDCSDVMCHSSFCGADLDKHPFLDGTLGWLDPVGAHNDYLQDGIYELIIKVLSRK